MVLWCDFSFFFRFLAFKHRVIWGTTAPELKRDSTSHSNTVCAVTHWYECKPSSCMMVCFPFWTLLVARGSFVVWRAHDSHIYLIMVFAVSVRVYLIRIEMCVGIWHFSCNTTLWLMLAVNCTSFWVACRGSCRPFWPRAMWIMGATEKKKKN